VARLLRLVPNGDIVDFSDYESAHAAACGMARNYERDVSIGGRWRVTGFAGTVERVEITSLRVVPIANSSSRPSPFRATRACRGGGSYRVSCEARPAAPRPGRVTPDACERPT
jgi:hypothetical protein